MSDVKPQSERLKESMEILGKLKVLGVNPNDPDYKQLSRHFSDWVKMGPTWQGSIPFYSYNRKAKVVLPTKPGTTAKCDFLHFVYQDE
jgi:hypothetical protein